MANKMSISDLQAEPRGVSLIPLFVMEPKSRVVCGARDEPPKASFIATRPSPSDNVLLPTGGEPTALSTNKKVAAATIKSFLSEQGVDVSDSRLDTLQAGLDVLFAGDGDEELEDETNQIVRAAEVYRRKGGKAMEPPEVVMDLAGQRHSLWGHRLWNAARVLADMIDANPALCRSKTVLELGAGAALPSLIAALNGARAVIASDYQNPHSNDSVLIDVIEANIARLCPTFVAPGVMHAVGYIWGQDLTPIRAPLLASSSPEGAAEAVGFDVIILADLLFNRSEHDSLLWTCRECLAPEGVALVAFGHHDPQKADLDLNFFSKAVAAPYNFVIEHIGQQQMKDLFVENDGLDEARGVVYMYTLRKRGRKQDGVTPSSTATPPCVASGKS